MFKTPRAAVLLVFAAFGIMVGSHLGALPIIVNNARVSETLFGSTQSIAMIAGLLAMALGSYISHHVDHRLVMLISLPSSLIALYFALTIRSPATYVLAYVSFAGLLTFLDLNMNAEGSVIETEVKKPIFTSFHASVSFTMAAGAILSSFLSATYGLTVPLLVAVPVVAWAMFAVWRYVPRRTPFAEIADAQPGKLPYRKLVLVGLTLGFSNCCEVAAELWAGKLLAQLRPELIAYSGLGVAFFGICAGCWRLIGDRMRARYGEIAILTGGLAVTLSGFAVLAAGPGFMVSVLAFAAIGFGMSPNFPGLFAMAGRFAPSRQAAAIGFSAAVSGVPRFVMPAILGLAAEAYGLRALYSLTAVLAALSLALVVLVLAPLEKGAATFADAPSKA